MVNETGTRTGVMDPRWLTLAQASRQLPTHPSVSTVWRWCRHGLRGVRLEYRRLGDRLVITEAAINEFMDRLTRLDQQLVSVNSSEPQAPGPTQSEIETRLRQEGLL